MKKSCVLGLALVLVVAMSGIAGAVDVEEVQVLVGGSDYLAGGAVLDSDNEIADQPVDYVVMGGYDSYGSGGVEILGGIHWDRVEFGDTITEDFNYQFGLGYSTADYIGASDILVFAKTSYQINDETAVGLYYSNSNFALSANYDF